MSNCEKCKGPVSKGTCQKCGHIQSNSIYNVDKYKALEDSIKPTPKTQKEFKEWCEKMGIEL